MDTNLLYSKIEEENINYINSKLKNTRGAIANYQDITAIIVDDDQIDSQIAENTVLVQELGHYYAGAYYRTYSDYELIEKMEHKADVSAWKNFLPYAKVKELLNNGVSTITELADFFNVEAPYMARCIHYYANESNRFTKENIA